MEQLENIHVAWFDLVVALFLFVGYVKGRTRGLSAELLDVFQWLTIVVVPALFYPPLGAFISSAAGLSLFTANLIAYVVPAIGIKCFFSFVKRCVGQKIVGSDVFGSAEYVLGALGGMVRYGCMILVALAVLNAKLVTKKQRTAMARMEQDNFGMRLIPTVGFLQQDVFVHSYSGRFVKNHLEEQLIAPSSTQDRPDSFQRFGQREDSQIKEILSGSR